MNSANLLRASDKKIMKPLYVTVFALLFFVCFVFIAYDSFSTSIPAKSPAVLLNDGWKVYHNGEELQEDALDAIKTGKVPEGDTYVLARTLDSELCLDPCLMIRLPQAVLYVKADGKEFFSYNIGAIYGERMGSLTTVFVPLTQDMAGKELEITLISTKSSSFYGLGPVIYGEHSGLTDLFISQRRVPFILGLFLLMLGVAQLVYVPILTDEKSVPDMSLLFGALSTFDIGLFLLSSYGLFDLFIDYANANTLIECISFYFLPCLISVYFLTLTEGSLKRLHALFAAVDLLLLYAAIMLHYFNTIFITEFMLMFRLLLILESTPYLFMLLKGRNSVREGYMDPLQEFSDRLIVFSLIFYAICYTADMLMKIIIRAVTGRENPYGIPFTMMGCLVFAIMIQARYFLHSLYNLRIRVIRMAMEKRAFVDSLTGLKNRAGCQQVLEHIGKEKIPFEIISLDLDKLKQVNDAFGHTEGDKYLQTVANILNAAFSGARLIGRMAGDEFIVILTGDDVGKAKIKIEYMNQIIDSVNEASDMKYVSVSAGSAMNSEKTLGARAFDIYMLADKRMYEIKQGKYSEDVRSHYPGDEAAKESGVANSV